MAYKVTYFDSDMNVIFIREYDSFDVATYEARCYELEGFDPFGPNMIPIGAIHMTGPNGTNYKFNHLETVIKDLWVEIL